jgi:uncharacterized protein YcbK (DUF882 family)
MKTYPKGSNEQLCAGFKAYEFDCPCDYCKETPIDDELVLRLQELRELLGFPIKITSGYRCERYQNELKARGYETAKGISQHQLGKAADIKTGHHTGKELEAAARKVGFLAVGVGKEFIHVDLRPEHHSWAYSY